MLVSSLAHPLYDITLDTLLCLSLSILRQYSDRPYSINENVDGSILRHITHFSLPVAVL